MTIAATNMRVLLFTLACCILVGCGSDVHVVPVTGTIKTADGRVLENGVITFIPQNADEAGLATKPASGNVIDGKFVLSTLGQGDGAVMGNHTLELNDASLTEKVKDESGKEKSIKQTYQLSPESMTATVLAGKNHFDLLAIPIGPNDINRPAAKRLPDQN